MRIGGSVGFGPIRVGAGVSSRGAANGCAGFIALGLVALFAIWPHMLFTSLAQKMRLSAVAETGMAWGAEALWVEFLLVLAVAANGGGSFVRALYLGARASSAGAKVIRAVAVGAVPMVLGSTIAMAVVGGAQPVDQGSIGPASSSQRSEVRAENAQTPR